MNKMKKLVALTVIMALFGSQVQGQEFAPPPPQDYTDVQGSCDECAPVCCDDSAAYCDSGRASYLSAALPIGALAVAAIIIATTNRHHHHSSSSSSSRSRSHHHGHHHHRNH